MLKWKKIMLLIFLISTLSTNSTIYASDKDDSENNDNNYHYIYTTTSVHLRENPKKKSKSIRIFKANTKLICKDSYKNLKTKKWIKVKYKNDKGYVYSQYLSRTKNYVNMSTPSNNSFKSYMSYKCITDKSSNQYRLQTKCHTGVHGIRMYGGRYCIAVGSYYTTKIGTKIDLIMKNGSIIKCILADCKADIHTDSKNRQNKNGSIVEFVVDTDALSNIVKRMGDVSYSNKHFKGEIAQLRVYK